MKNHSNTHLASLSLSIAAGIMPNHTNIGKWYDQTTRYNDFIPHQSEKINIEDETLEQFRARREEMKKRYMKNKSNGKISI